MICKKIKLISISLCSFIVADQVFALNTSGIVTPSVASNTNNPSNETTVPVTIKKKKEKKVTKQANQVQEQSKQTEDLYRQQLQKNPNDEDVRIALADYYLSKYHDLAALEVINQGLRLNPRSVKLLTKLSDIQTLLSTYALAIKTNKKILTLEPQNESAKEYLAEVNKIIPRYAYGVNEIGISSDNAYVTGFHQIWDYSTVYYTRETNIGQFGGRVNFAAREGFTAPQYELDLSPILNRNVSFNLIATYAHQPELFADYSYGGQANVNFTDSVQASGGAIYSSITSTFFMTYLAALSYAKGNYWFSFSPYYFVPKTNVNSLLLTGIVRRYFTTEDHSITLTVGLGHSPDLANLTTVDFIIIKNDFANLTYEFPILSHHFVIDLQAGYQRWAFPTGEVFNFYDTNVGLKYRF